MCLSNKPPHVKAFLAEHAGKEYVECYKVLEFGGRGELKAPFRGTRYKTGWNHSNSKATQPNKKWVNINKGIHVYTSYHEAHCYTGYIRVVVKVRCYLSDLIGVDGDKRQAVFSKVYLSKVARKNKECKYVYQS
jgi:hypothetical protein